MQDLHSMDIDGGVRRRLFPIESDQRLLPLNQQHELKCPGCESLNTKFCFYNNYNLSQPRHFCRSCKSYWTKGGVLRNVPVGGGIRKPKRASKHSSKTSVPSSETIVTKHKSSISENSSCNSSSGTANTTSVNITATTKGMTTMDASRSCSSSNSAPAMLLNFNEPSAQFFNFSHSSTQVTTIDPLMMNQSSSARNTSPDIAMFKSQQQSHPQWTETERMAEIDYRGLESTRSNGGLAGNDDWQDIEIQVLFDQILLDSKSF